MHVQNVLRELKAQSSPRSSSARLTAFSPPPPMILLLPLLATLVVYCDGLGSLACDLSQNSPMLSRKPLCSWAKIRRIVLSSVWRREKLLVPLRHSEWQLDPEVLGRLSHHRILQHLRALLPHRVLLCDLETQNCVPSTAETPGGQFGRCWESKNLPWQLSMWKWP